MKREMGVAILVGGVVLMLVGGITRAWWTASREGDSIALGLRSVEMCSERRGCETMTYEAMGGDPGTRDRAFVMLGKMGFFGAFVLLALAVIASVLAFARPANVAPAARITAVVAALLLANAIAFVLLRESVAGLSVGYSLFLYMIGAPIAAVGAAVLAKRGVLPAAMPLGPGVAVPACPRCKAPTEWVAEHQRHLCRGCSIYV